MFESSGHQQDQDLDDGGKRLSYTVFFGTIQVQSRELHLPFPWKLLASLLMLRCIGGEAGEAGLTRNQILLVASAFELLYHAVLIPFSGLVIQNNLFDLRFH